MKIRDLAVAAAAFVVLSTGAAFAKDRHVAPRAQSAQAEIMPVSMPQPQQRTTIFGLPASEPTIFGHPILRPAHQTPGQDSSH